MQAIAILCSNIRRIRLARGWSQEVAAEKAGLGVRHYQDIEAGRRPGIRLETIARIAKVLHLQVWELLQPDRFPEPARQRGTSAHKITR